MAGHETESGRTRTAATPHIFALGVRDSSVLICCNGEGEDDAIRIDVVRRLVMLQYLGRRQDIFSFVRGGAGYLDIGYMEGRVYSRDSRQHELGLTGIILFIVTCMYSEYMMYERLCNPSVCSREGMP